MKSYKKPQPYFGDRRVCFECTQRTPGNSKPQIVVLSNHKGFLCPDCCVTSVSFRVRATYMLYEYKSKQQQPFIADVVQWCLDLTDKGFRGTEIEFWKVLREREYNHLTIESVRLALDTLTANDELKTSNALNFVVYFSF